MSTLRQLTKNMFSGKNEVLRTPAIHLESLEKRILLSGNDPFTVDISDIYYQDAAGREIDFDFTGASINSQDEITLPASTYTHNVAGDDFDDLTWGPVDDDITQDYDGTKATAGIDQPTDVEVGGVIALIPDGTEGTPSNEWTLDVTIGPFSGVDGVGNNYEVAVGVGSYDDAIWTDMYVNWFTSTFENVYYDHALTLGAYVGNDFTGEQWEPDPIILTGYDPSTTVIDLRAAVIDGDEISGSYRIHGESWTNDAFELTLPSGTFNGFPAVYPFLSMYAEPGDGDGEVTEVWFERGLDNNAPGTPLAREFSVIVEGYDLDLLNIQTPWGTSFALSDHLVGAWEGGPLELSGDGWDLEGGTDDDGVNYLDVLWRGISPSEWNALDNNPGYVEVIYGGGVWSQTLDFSQVEVPNEAPVITYPAHQQTGVPAQPTIFWNEWSDPLKDGGVWVGIEETQTEIFINGDDLPEKTTSWTVPQVLDLNTQYSCGVVFYDLEFQRIDDADVYISSWNESDVHFTTGSMPPGPDLIGSFNDVTLGQISVPGDKGAAEIIISNVGDRPALGKFTLNVFASPDTVLDQNDLLVGSIQNKPVKLDPGDFKSFKSKLLIPLDTPADEYHLLAQIVPNGSIQERDPNNNTAATDGTGTVVWQFGSVGDRSNVQLKLQQPGGPLYTFALKGDGSGQINGGFNFDQLYLDGTTEATSVTVKSKESVTLNLINGDPSPLAPKTSLGKLSGKTLTLNGNVDLTGSLGQLQVDAIANGVQINTAQPAAKGTMVKVNEIGNVLFDIEGPINSLQANSYTAGLLSADSVNFVKIKQGDLGATIHAKTGDINNVSSAGNILGDILAENGSIIKVATKKGKRRSDNEREF